MRLASRLTPPSQDYGLQWESDVVTPGAEAETINYDFSAALTVTEVDTEEAVMRHYWPPNCTSRPPGALLRLLKVLDLQ